MLLRSISPAMAGHLLEIGRGVDFGPGDEAAGPLGDVHGQVGHSLELVGDLRARS